MLVAPFGIRNMGFVELLLIGDGEFEKFSPQSTRAGKPRHPDCGLTAELDATSTTETISIRYAA